MTRWLSPAQQADWRAWISVSSLLPDRLSRELQEHFNITLSDYEILVRLSESDKHQVRMSDLAEKTLISRSRLSHQIDRLVDAGLVERRACDDDRRGQWASLTKKGFQLLKDASHIHVEGVRNHFLDQLSDAEFSALGKALKKVAGHLENL